MLDIDDEGIIQEIVLVRGKTEMGIIDGAMQSIPNSSHYQSYANVP